MITRILCVFSAGALMLLLPACAAKKSSPVPDAAAPYSMARVMAQAPSSHGPQAEHERYAVIDDNPVRSTARDPVSTFSVDVDTGAYSNVRRFLRLGQLPPKDAVRAEELINYFPYEPLPPQPGHPFAVVTDIAPSPWSPDRQLLRVRIDAVDVKQSASPPANLVFLVDVSGSMDSPDKLPLVRASLQMLTKRLRPEDRVSIVVYAGRTCVELPSVSGKEQAQILNAIRRLEAGGATAGEAAIRLTYDQARSHFIPGGINRILLATDGDFNVGLASTEELRTLIEQERRSGISLTALGFGTGNYNDELMEQMADAGNGNFSYIDSVDEARKVLIEEMSSTFNTVASDAKVQIEFNPATISEYRLIGYENRLLNETDFNNDSVDAGEIGAGKTVTALYELTPVGASPQLTPRRYESQTTPVPLAMSTELGFLRVRYKPVGSQDSVLLEQAILPTMAHKDLSQAAPDLRFAAAVAAFSQRLRGGHYIGDFRYSDIIALALSGLGEDAEGYRREFIRLVEAASELDYEGTAAAK